MNDARRTDQLYVFISPMRVDPRQFDVPDDEMAKRRHACPQTLPNHKILVGSGSARDETG